MLRRIIKAIWNQWWMAAPAVAALLLIILLLPELRQQSLQVQEPGPFSCENTLGVPPGEPISTNFFAVRGQLILTGPQPQLEKAEGLLNAEIGVQLMRTCNLSFFAELVNEQETLPPFFPFSRDEASQLQMRLYALPDAQVATAVALINPQFSDLRVFADPNYLIGVLGQNQCGSPHEPGGSPHEPGGSPFEAIGDSLARGGPIAPGGRSPQPGVSSPTPSPSPSPTLAVTPTLTATSVVSGTLPQASTQEFWDQWAFEHIGIIPPLQDTYGWTGDLPTGEDVLVAVFDTSPFSITQQIRDDIKAEVGRATRLYSETQRVAWFDQSRALVPLELTVSYPDPTRIDALTPITPGITPKVADHGLFVAGLVHAVAPDSQIDLIRVLNDYGCGDLQSLYEALNQYIDQKRKERPESVAPPGARLGGIVINMSLGIDTPRSVDKPIRPETAELLAPADLDILEKDPLELLLTTLSLADSHGAVIVAAAGNESTETAALPMHIPADYPFVIGVAASNMERGRACFSNWGDVSAPGGEGGPDSHDPPRPCMPKHAACQGNCPDAVISLALGGAGGDPSASYYRYWSGTSFSTPLVSGLAALLLDGSYTPPDYTWAKPAQVFTAVRCGAPTPDGIINVPDSLFRCPP